MRKWKKKHCLSILFVVFTMCGMLYLSSRKNNSAPFGEVISITQREMKSKFNNQDTFIAVVTRDNCKYCHEWNQMISDYLQDHDVTIYDLNIDKNKLSDDNEIRKLFPSYIGTPNIFCVKDGKIVSQYDNMNGTLNAELFDKWVQKYAMEK